MQPEVEELRPTPAQERFLRSPAKEVLFGGSAGGGKSFALLMHAIRRVENPHAKTLALRRTFTEMLDNLVSESSKYYPYIGGTFNAQKNQWRFSPSGATVSYGYCQHEVDRERYRSSEYTDIEWDELTTHKRETDYLYINSRARNSRGLPCYIRAYTNPGDRGHQWVFRRWAPWLWVPGVAAYPGALCEDRETIPRPKPGEILWFRTEEGTGKEICTHRRWHDPKCKACHPNEPCPTHTPQSRTFFPSRLEDNPYLSKSDYAASLHNLPPLERARMLNGDWNIVPAAGLYFRRATFRKHVATPPNVIARVRYWDRASTEGGGDWTAGVRMALVVVTVGATEHPYFVVEHVERGQWGPGMVESTIVGTADTDPYGTIVALEQDPAQAGKVEAYNYGKILTGRDYRALPPQGNKLTRARPVSAKAWAPNGTAYGGIGYVEGQWNQAYFVELEAFDGLEESPDDQVDATSGAFRVLLEEWRRHEQRRERSGGGGAYILNP